MLRIFTCCAALLFLVVPAFSYDNGQVPVNTPESAKRMIEDLIATFGEKYPKGPEYLKQLEAIAEKIRKNPRDAAPKAELKALLREAALANPLLDFDKIVLVRRNTQKRWGFVGLNSYTNDTIPRKGWDNELVVLSDLRVKPKLTPIYKHPDGAIMRDPDLHFDGKRILFSSINEFGNWAVFEFDTESKKVRELTPSDQKDVDWFDACYLPEDGKIIVASTAGMQGLPCENGGKKMANLYRVSYEANEVGSTTQKMVMDTTLSNRTSQGRTGPVDARVRQLTFEQDSDWHPSVMHDGRVMYLRWEYSDIPHYMSRILFAMQPDGRQQRAIWGSGSYFPTAYKNPRVVPGHSSMVVGVVSGHHKSFDGLPEVGRLVLLNPQLGSKYPFRYDPTSKEWAPQGTHLNIFPRVFPKETTGCVQEIPGYGRDVVGNLYDNQGGVAKYKFAYPYPLSENYFLTSMRVDDRGMFGLWLVDRFDNMVKIKDLPNDSLFHAMPLVARPKPPVRADLTDPSQEQGTMFITDVYHGDGLKGVPRGTAKSLRIFAYHYGYRNSGGHDSVGMVSSWDIKRILGTVPVEEDGSACFNIPANTPISIQVCDAEGRALQLMRSWTLCMPGEQQSCVGCHETPLEVTPAKHTIAGNKAPHDITPWYGPARPFGYEAEIQPMLEAKCVSCHNDVTRKERKMISFEAHRTGNWRTDTSYASLNPFTWRPGPEPDLDMLPPCDYHASVSELVQRFKKGSHYGVELDKEDWDRIYTWIDLNVPYRGQWTNPEFEKRRLELQKLYADVDVNPEAEYREQLAARKPIAVEKLTSEQLDEVVEKYAATDSLTLENWPFDAQTALKMQRDDTNSRIQMKLTVDLATEKQEDVVLRFAAMSDVHYSGDLKNPNNRNVVRFKKSLEMIKGYPSFDALIVAGDMTNHGTKNQIGPFKEHLDEGLPTNVRRLLCMGNHEFYGGSRKLWEEVFETPGNTHHVINGFHFIGFSPEKGTMRNGDYLYCKDWVRRELEKADEDSSDKPIFVFQHYHITGTVYGTLKGDNSSGIIDLYDLMQEYPRVINFSGHSHYPITDPRSAWQGRFTAFGTGTLSNFWMTPKEPGCPAQPPGANDAAQFYIVEVYKDNTVVLKPYDLITDSFFDTVYTVSEPGNLDKYLYTDSRYERPTRPAWRPDSCIAIQEPECLGATFHFPQAECPRSDEKVFAYRLSFSKKTDDKSTKPDKSDEPLEYHAWSYYFMRNMPTTLSIPVYCLEPDSDYHLKIAALNCFQKESETALETHFRTPVDAMLPADHAAERPEPDILNVSFSVEGASNNPSNRLMPRKMETVGAPEMVEGVPNRFAATFNGKSDAFIVRYTPGDCKLLQRRISIGTRFVFGEFDTARNTTDIFGCMEQGGYGFVLNHSKKRVEFWLNIDGKYTILTHPVVPGETYTLFGVYTGRELRFHVNGKEVSKRNKGGAIQYPLSDLAKAFCIGGDMTKKGGVASFFRGTIEFARVYCWDLTSRQIAAISET